MDRRCVACSSGYPDHARFCPRCGRRVEAVTIELPVIERRPVWPKMVFGFAVFMAVFTLLVRMAAQSTVLSMKGPRDAFYAPQWEAPLVELSQTPAVLIDPSVASTQVTLHGVRLGDARHKIPGHLFGRTPGARGARVVRLEDGNQFYLPNGTVTRIVLEDPELLAQIGVRDATDLVLKFGAADVRSYTNNGGPHTLYTYASRGVTLRWDERGDRLDQVVLTVPTAAVGVGR